MSLLDRQSGPRVSIRTVPPAMRVAAVALIAACGSSHSDQQPTNENSAVNPQQTPGHMNPLESEVLAMYEGEWDGPHNTLRLTRMSPGQPGQISQHLVLASLAGATNGPTGTTTPSANTVLLHQTATRSLDSACNSAPYGDTGVPGGFTGVCVPIQAISGYASAEILRLHVQFVALQYNGPTMGGTVTTYVKTPSDSGFNTSNTHGLWNYGRLSENGVTDSGSNQLDRASRNWYFQTTDAGSMATFHFRLAIKGEVVNPIRLVGNGSLTCVPDANTRPSVSSDGRYVTYMTSSPVACRAGGGLRQIYRYDTQTSTNTLVSHTSSSTTTGSNGLNSRPTMSSDGRWVAWLSTGTNLLPGGGDGCGYVDNNAGLADVFVRDMNTDTIYIASADDFAAMPGSPAVASANPSISPNGAAVVFDTTAQIDANGLDANAFSDVYRRLVTGCITELVSPDTSRTTGATNGATSNDGNQIVFQSSDTFGLSSDSNSALDVFVINMNTGVVRRISSNSGGSAGNAASQNGTISADGNVVAFESIATDMIGSTTAARSHIYVRTTDGTLSGLARADSPASGEANGAATLPSLSSTGRMVTFTSPASNIDSLDTTTDPDAYMFDRTSTDSTRTVPFVVSLSRSNAVASGGINSGGGVTIAGSDNYAVFMSTATNLTATSPTTSPSLYIGPLR
jgi:hypothetical protein